MLAELVRKTRSYRRFYEDEPIGEEALRELVDLARLSASGGNLQPLKYLLAHTPEKNELIFGKIRINLCKWYHVKCQIPGCVPGILPFVGHRDNVSIV